ncbi:hypothetical protein LCGC14_3146600, partial [marine sediment metagenome]
CFEWNESLIEGPLEDIQDRLTLLKKSFPGYERIEVGIDRMCSDQDCPKLSVVGFRQETDEEYEKRKDKLLKQRAAQRKRREKEKEEGEEVDEYEQYLVLKAKYEKDWR